MDEALFHEMFDCDAARISQLGDRMYLIIGNKRHTKDDPDAQWTKNGKPFDFEYLAEVCVASGNTEAELVASAEEYKRLESMTMLELLLEQRPDDDEN